MIRFVVVTMAGVAHEFSADAVDPGGDSLKFFEGEVEKKCFLKSEVLCWDSDVRGHLKLGSWGLPATEVGD
jgi:hypothetical protein